MPFTRRVNVVLLGLEMEKFCFKIQEHNKLNQSADRAKWHAALVAKSNAPDAPLRVKEPDRFGKGTWMTIGIVEPYLQTNAKGLLDFDAGGSQKSAIDGGHSSGREIVADPSLAFCLVEFLSLFWGQGAL